jgi:hypothetical protein
MQESPIVQEFITMNLCPRFDEALLHPWQSSASTDRRPPQLTRTRPAQTCTPSDFEFSARSTSCRAASVGRV